MSKFDAQWQKLTALARQVPDDRPVDVPYAFATRVAARAATLPSANPWAVLERIAVRGLMVAAALGMVTFVLNYSSLTSEASVDYTATDAVTELIDLS